MRPTPSLVLLASLSLLTAACGDGSTSSSAPASGFDAGIEDGGITSLDGSATGADGSSASGDTSSDSDDCWWCFDADASSAPETLAGEGGDDKGGGAGKLTLEACIEECVAKGETEEACGPICEEYLGATGEGDCFEDCLKKGGTEAECEAACGPSDDGGGPDDPGASCYDACIEKGYSEEECAESCDGDGDPSDGSDKGGASCFDDCMEKGASEEECTEACGEGDDS